MSSVFTFSIYNAIFYLYIKILLYNFFLLEDEYSETITQHGNIVLHLHRCRNNAKRYTAIMRHPVFKEKKILELTNHVSLFLTTILVHCKKLNLFFECCLNNAGWITMSQLYLHYMRSHLNTCICTMSSVVPSL